MGDDMSTTMHQFRIGKVILFLIHGTHNNFHDTCNSGIFRYLLRAI